MANPLKTIGLAVLVYLAVPGSSLAQSGGAYDFNRKPLKQDTYVQLPLGSIKAKGWLLKQLEQQRDGATGHAEELYPEDANLGKGSDWLGGTEAGWERVPYYVKGLVALAYTLDDAGLKAKAQKYIEWTLNSQQSDGLFGPAKMKDWWPRMPMMYALQGYFEATGDKRVVPFLHKYLKYELAHLDADPLKDWGKSRAADNMEIAIWVYNKTSDADLLKLLEKLKEQAYPWIDIYTKNQFYYYGDDFQPKHMVNVAQALKFPVVYGQLDDRPANLKALDAGIRHLMRDHGQPQGLGSGTEFLAGRSSIQGVETCSVVEWMQSLETAGRVLHDAHIGDQLEQVAFNALPAQFSRDFKNHSYYALPNQVLSIHGGHGFNQDYGTGIISSPYSGFPCCRYNMHMGWPYFVKNSVVATPEHGLAMLSYGPMEVNAVVAGDQKLKLLVETNYPFEEKIRLKVSLNKPVSFPLVLRIPGWSVNPEIRYNGQLLKGVQAGKMFTLAQLWKEHDVLELNFPMEVSTRPQVNNAVSVELGPLVYALEIKAKNRITKTHVVQGFSDYEILPESSWNYGLVLGSDKSVSGVKVLRSAMADNPFIAADAPLKLKMQARKIPEWGISYNKVAAFDVPVSPVASNAPVEEITLVPFGSENIRLSLFPVIGTPGKRNNAFSEDFREGMPEDWVFYGGGWFWKDGAIHAASNAGSGSYGIDGSKIVANGTAFSDFEYEATVELTSSGDAGMIFRLSKPAIGADAYQGYYVGLNPSSGLVTLGKANGYTWQVISSKAANLKQNQQYRLKVQAKGKNLKVFLDGAKTPIIAADDEDYKSGSIGLRTYKAQASFDQVKVKGL